MIAFVSTETKFAEKLQKAALKEGFDIKCFFDGGFKDVSADFWIVDLDFPYEWFKFFKNKGVKNVILVASKKNREFLKFLKLGISDYLIKPLFVEEVLFKLRRFCYQCCKIGDLEIDFSKNIAVREEKNYSLTKKERDLLYLFINAKDKIVSYEQIRNYVYSYNYPSDNAIHLLVSRMKRKLSLNIVSVPNQGYILKV